MSTTVSGVAMIEGVVEDGTIPDSYDLTVARCCSYETAFVWKQTSKYKKSNEFLHFGFVSSANKREGVKVSLQ